MTGSLPGAVRAALLPLARAGRTVTYRDLAGLVPVPPPHGIHKLTEALEHLVREDHAAGRPLIAALAVSRVGETVPGRGIPGEGMPGRGFFQLLSELGRYEGPDRGPAAAAAHASELAAALAYWGAETQDSPEPQGAWG